MPASPLRSALRSSPISRSATARESWSWAAATGVLWGLGPLLAPPGVDAGPQDGQPDEGAATRMNKSPTKGGSPAKLIDAKIDELADWRGELLARLRAIIKKADPDVVEEWKWGGVPVWSHDGIITTGETYKSVVKLTFAKGVSPT